MITKKHPNKNEYCLSKDGYWVRNFTKPIVNPIDINDLMPLEDIKLVLANEIKNNTRSYQRIDSENFNHEKVVIIGDGYNFESTLKIIEELPSDVITICVNKAFAKWDSPRRINYYVVNNPYQDCLYYYPQLIRSWPKCVASLRTNPNFLEIYGGSLYTYSPTVNQTYSGGIDSKYYVDDYRNPVCAALNLCYRFKAKKIALMSILEMYSENKPGAEQLQENLWIYPQQKMALSLIDANLYWLKNAKISVCYTDDKPNYEFATYISSNDLKRFFK